MFQSNCFLGRGYGGVFTARRRWRFDTSIFRISKVDRPYKGLRNSICRSRVPFLDHLFAHFLNFWKPPNWCSWRHDQNKNAIWEFFGVNSQCINDPFCPTNCASRSCLDRSTLKIWLMVKLTQISVYGVVERVPVPAGDSPGPPPKHHFMRNYRSKWHLSNGKRANKLCWCFLRAKSPKSCPLIYDRNLKSFPAPFVLNHASYGHLDRNLYFLEIFQPLLTCFGVDFVVLSVGADWL